MSAPISNTVSTFIDSQLPQFIRDNNPNFSAFIKAYYEWMEQSVDSGIIREGKSLLSYNDIDSTTDEFIQYFINDFLPYFPNDTVLDERKLLKSVRDFYQKKGSIESLQFLFRVLYGKEAEIYYPKDQVLRASDGKWYLPQALRLVLDPSNINFDINQLVGRQGLGSVSNTSCVIEAATKTVDQGLGIELIELYVSNINKPFSDLENLNVIYGYYANGTPMVFTEKIIASLSDIKINPNYQGTRYHGAAYDGTGALIYPGDPVSIIGGLQGGDSSARKAVAYVNAVSTGSITGVSFDYGGCGYRVDPNTIVTVVNDPSDNTGTGANIIVTSIDTTNAIYINVCTDAIIYEAPVALNATTYNFANVAYANANTPLGVAFSFANLQFASLTGMDVLNGGANFQAVPSLELQVTYYTDYLANLVGNTTYVSSNMQFMDDLGLICNVVIQNGGVGYNPVTDQIVVPSSVGYGANFSFTVTGSGAIDTVTINNRGEGFVDLPLNLLVVNSANHSMNSAGNSASLICYGFGQGANLALQVNQIGQIQDFRLTSRGFDYISTPKISLRVADLIITSIPSEFNFSTDQVIYQGSSLSAATWSANVDSYNLSKNLLRIYNYQGNLNLYANIVAGAFNTTINTASTSNVKYYGDGLAKANAIFQNGLISYPGFYLKTDGFLSSDQYLQDSDTYHNYSYLIVVEKAMREYKKTLLQLVHPSGMSMLGRYSIIQDNLNPVNSAANVNIIPLNPGTISSNALYAVVNH